MPVQAHLEVTCSGRAVRQKPLAVVPGGFTWGRALKTEMLTAIEIASRTIRLCQIQDRRVVTLESYPVPADMDPIEVLQTVPLPAGIAKARVVVHHEDVLVRALVQPPCAPDRLERVVRFELGNTAGNEPVLYAWKRNAQLTQGEDLRVLAVVAKTRFVNRLKQALSHHGVTLAAIQHPAVAMYQAWRARGVAGKESCLLIDVGGQQMHLALILDGELVFVRSQSSAMDELVKQVVTLRGVPESDAAMLVSQIGKNMPGDLAELIRKQAASIASALAANVRFARTQLQVESIEPSSIWLSGSGARVHHFAESLAEQMRVPVRLMNPFAGLPLSIPGERLDRMSALPSCWTPVIGAAHEENPCLDVLEDERRARIQQLTTMGSLKIAAAVIAALLILGVALQELATWRAQGVIDELTRATDGASMGMVAKATKLESEIKADSVKIVDKSARMAWLDKERRPGRVANEMLAVIDAIRNPDDCRVVLRSFKMKRLPAAIAIELEGFAETGAKRTTDQVLRAFAASLVKGYPPITGLAMLPTKTIASSHQQFRWVVTVADQPAVEKNREQSPINQKPGLNLVVVAPPGSSDADLESVAQAMAVRARSQESTIKVSVIPSGGSVQDAKETAVVFKD